MVDWMDLALTYGVPVLAGLVGLHLPSKYTTTFWKFIAALAKAKEKSDSNNAKEGESKG